jgi:CHAT domain-containing protein
MWRARSTMPRPRSPRSSDRPRFEQPRAPWRLLAVAVWLAATGAAFAQDATQPWVQRGAAAYQRGALEEAAAAWTEAARLHAREGRSREETAVLVRLARALQALGRHGDATERLERARALAGADRAPAVEALAALGSVATSAGDLERAHTVLGEAETLAREPRERAVVLNELGNLRAARGQVPPALAAYREAADLAGGAGLRPLAARALTNAALLATRGGEPREARGLLDRAAAAWRALPRSHDRSYGLIGVALGARDLRAALPDAAGELWLGAARMLREAGEDAEALGDARAVSYAWGHLGALYEAEGRTREAMRLTRRAVVAAQRVQAPESLYRWQWQSGRLLHAAGRLDEAIAAYRRAVGTLETLRLDFVSGPRASPLSFRQSVGPVYLELVDLLLRRAAALGDGEAAAPYLREARQSVELLKVAELRDYFRDDCVDAARARVQQLDVVSPTAVVVYPILLADRTELLVTVGGGLRRFAVPVGAEALTREVRQFRRLLEKRTTREFLPHARQLYDWLIRPLEPELARHRVDTLVFVPDGPLRTIPMAALHDGRQFLVSRFALGTTPSMDLTDPRPLARERTRVLALGLTESVQGFPPLPHVSDELAAISRAFGSVTLVNEAFRMGALEQSLREERFGVVHIASHGQFEGDVDRTFLVTFDGRLTMDRLDRMIGQVRTREEPLELLTLSACETAAGDDRAALGLAGVAVKAGARSALATLWYINDEASAELIGAFYRNLQDPSISRAVALQRAQQALLADPRYAHPALWSPFLLINNWL